MLHFGQICFDHTINFNVILVLILGTKQQSSFTGSIMSEMNILRAR
jgi:hypothetical protein